MSQQSQSHKQGRYVEYDNKPGQYLYGKDECCAGDAAAAFAVVESQFGEETQPWLQLALSEITQKVDTDPATITVSVNVTGDEIQDAIDASLEGDIIEVTHPGPYNPIIFPTHPLTIRSTVQTQIQGAQCVSFPDGAEDQIFSGFEFPATLYSTPANNYIGAAISFASQGSKLDKVIIHNCRFEEVVNGSAVMMCYHWSVGGDDYAAQQLLEENSNRMALIDCVFDAACKDGNEGAAITLRGFNLPIVFQCQVDGNGVGNTRGIQFLNCVDVLCLNNECHDIVNREGIKLDWFGNIPGKAEFQTTGRIEGNVCYDCDEGIDSDDQTDALIINNLCFNCSTAGIMTGDEGTPPPNVDVVRNTVHSCGIGIRYREDVTGIYYGNIVYGNTTNYSIESEYAVNAQVWIEGVDPTP